MLNNISNNKVNYSKVELNKDNSTTKTTTENSQVKRDDTAVIFELSKKTEKNNSQTSKREQKKKISYMVNQAQNQTKNFEKLISSTFSKQSNKSTLLGFASSNNLKSFYKNLKVDAKTIEQAKKDVSEDGYYGVKQTSERILGLAKAVAGDDPKQIEKMKTAVEKGFKQAEKMWGDKLPEISQKTYDTVMETFASWQSK